MVVGISGADKEQGAKSKMSLPGGPWPPSADPPLLSVQALLKISVPDVLCLHRQGQVREDTQTFAVQEAIMVTSGKPAFYETLLSYQSSALV